MLPRAARAAVGASCAGAAAVVAARRHSEGFDRAFRFGLEPPLSTRDVAFVQIRFQGGDSARYQKELETLHRRYADEALDIVLSLRGLFVKIGQLASMRDDAMPEEYLMRFRKLQYNVPAAPVSYVKSVICNELGVSSWDEVFSHIDAEPLGAASIGQCHAATLKSDGKRVCVKIMYPEVERLFEWDFSVIKNFCKLAMPSICHFSVRLKSSFCPSLTL